MEKENYKAWKIKTSDFNDLKTNKEKLGFLLKFAVLAPSSHNTQPWAFRIEGNKVLVYKENLRRLPIADKNDRQLFLSIGCMIENLLVAADYYGYTSNVKYTDGSDQKDLVATIEFVASQKNNDYNHLIKSILTRKTNRGKYKKELIDNSILEEFSNLANQDVIISIVNDEAKKSKLTDIAVNASIDSMTDSGFRKELSQYLKNNLTKSKIGMPGFTLNIPTPLSFFMPKLIEKFNMEKIGQKQSKALLNEFTPYLVIISSVDDKIKNWITAGSKFQRLALIAEKNNLSTAPWGAPIQIKDYYQQIQKVLGISSRPQMFFRLGYPTIKGKPSPRLLAEDVIIK